MIFSLYYGNLIQWLANHRVSILYWVNYKKRNMDVILLTFLFILAVVVIVSISSKKGIWIAVTGGGMLFVGAMMVLYDVARVMFGGGLFSSPELSITTLIGVVMIYLSFRYISKAPAKNISSEKET